MLLSLAVVNSAKFIPTINLNKYTSMYLLLKALILYFNSQGDAECFLSLMETSQCETGPGPGRGSRSSRGPSQQLAAWVGSQQRRATETETEERGGILTKSPTVLIL